MTRPETMTNQELRELVAGLSIAQARTEAAQAKTDEQIAHTTRAMQETDQIMKELATKHKELSSMLGGLANSQGEAAEEFFINTVTQHPVINGIRFDSLHPNLIVMKADKKFAEFDMVLVNGKSAALFEVKHKPSVKDLDQVLTALKRYREAFPEHSQYKLYGGIAGFTVSKAVVHAAQKHGLFVLKRSGNVFESQNQNLHSF